MDVKEMLWNAVAEPLNLHVHVSVDGIQKWFWSNPGRSQKWSPRIGDKTRKVKPGLKGAKMRPLGY